MDVVKNLGTILYRRIEVSDTLIKMVGIFGVFNFPFFYFVHWLLTTGEQEYLFLRITCLFICIPLLFIDYWPSTLKRYKAFYWYFSICYIFPFFSTYMFIENYGSLMWFTKVIIGLFWLVLVTDWLTFLIILPSGVLLGWLIHYLINGTPQIEPNLMISLSINYFWALLIGTVFSRIKENVQQERLIAMKTLAGTIAHEMRTPFLGIRLNAGIIKKYLPVLVDTYNRAKTAQLEILPLSEKNIQHLKDTPDDLDKITSSASLAIDMLLTSLKDESSKAKFNQACSIKGCIQEMLQEYPLMKEEKSLISWAGKPDFTFYGNSIFMKHVLFNLLKNALYYVKAAHKGNISISTELTSKGNYLYFKDTGMGIAASEISHIFDQFYSKTHHGTGLGLSFCKSVMESIGGSINCEAREGEYTTFILKFPITKNKGLEN